MVEFNAMKNTKDDFKKDDRIKKKAMEEPLPGITTTTELGTLRSTSDNNSKTNKQKAQDSN